MLDVRSAHGPEGGFIDEAGKLETGAGLMVSWLKQNIGIVVSVMSAAVLLFLSGMAWGHLQLPLAGLVSNTIDAVQDWRVNGEAYLGWVPLKHLQPRRLAGDGLVVYDPETGELVDAPVAG